MAYLEAYIDFPDEDIPQELVDKLLNDVFKLQTAIDLHLKGDSVGERLREGFRVVIVGPPNAGKSSLLNAVVNRDAAIVSAVAGTTRDAVDVHLDIKGYPVMFTDTAGIREVEEEIENRASKSLFAKLPTPIWCCVCLMPQKTLFKYLIILKILLKTKRYLLPTNLII